MLEDRLPYLIVAPAILILLLVGLFPLIYSLIVSFQRITMTENDTSFVGFLNYEELFRDARLWASLGHTAIITAIAELGANGPTDSELERGLAQTEAQFIYRLQTIGGFGGKGDQLNAYNTFAGDPGYFERDRQRYYDVTRKGAAAAVQKWLVHAPLAALSVVPKGRRELALPGAAEVHVS
jgi:hypothetical protein